MGCRRLQLPSPPPQPAAPLPPTPNAHCRNSYYIAHWLQVPPGSSCPAQAAGTQCWGHRGKGSRRGGGGDTAQLWKGRSEVEKGVWRGSGGCGRPFPAPDLREAPILLLGSSSKRWLIKAPALGGDTQCTWPICQRRKRQKRPVLGARCPPWCAELGLGFRPCWLPGQHLSARPKRSVVLDDTTAPGTLGRPCPGGRGRAVFGERQAQLSHTFPLSC